MHFLMWLMGIFFISSITYGIIRFVWKLIGSKILRVITTIILLIVMMSGILGVSYHSLTSPNNQIITKGENVSRIAQNNGSKFQQLVDRLGISKLYDKLFGNHTSTSNTLTVDEQKILHQLLLYTTESSAGPTRNYAWRNGNAKLVSDKDINVGQLSFSTDSQGRASLARGKLTYKMYIQSKGSRQGVPLTPSNGGWPVYNPKVTISYALTGRSYHGYMFNRSHSIADSLGGSASYRSVNNFTTGTRAQNVGADQHGGMRAAEELAENYWYTHSNSSSIIQYQVLPLYYGNEKIPRGTIVNEKSSDDQLNTQIIVINDVEGYQLNYNNGTISNK